MARAADAPASTVMRRLIFTDRAEAGRLLAERLATLDLQAPLVLALPRGQTKVGKAEADDFRTALDRAASKVRNQLQKESRRPPHGASGD